MATAAHITAVRGSCRFGGHPAGNQVDAAVLDGAVRIDEKHLLKNLRVLILGNIVAAATLRDVRRAMKIDHFGGDGLLK